MILNTIFCSILFHESLYNACGVRSTKKKRAILGLNKGSLKERKGKRSNKNSKIGESLKQRLMALGREVVMQRSMVESQRKKLGVEREEMKEKVVWFVAQISKTQIPTCVPLSFSLFNRHFWVLEVHMVFKCHFPSNFTFSFFHQF